MNCSMEAKLAPFYDNSANQSMTMLKIDILIVLCESWIITTEEGFHIIHTQSNSLIHYCYC